MDATTAELKLDLLIGLDISEPARDPPEPAEPVPAESDTSERGRVLAALDAAADGLSPAQVATIAGLTHANARQLLRRMELAGEIRKTGHGRYCHNACHNNAPATPREFSAKPREALTADLGPKIKDQDECHNAAPPAVTLAKVTTTDDPNRKLSPGEGMALFEAALVERLGSERAAELLNRSSDDVRREKRERETSFWEDENAADAKG